MIDRINTVPPVNGLTLNDELLRRESPVNPHAFLCAAEVFDQGPDVQPAPQPQVAPRTRIENQVQAAIRHVLDNPNIAANAITFPEGVPPLTVEQITRLRAIPNNRADLIEDFQREIVNFRVNVRQCQLDLIQLTSDLDDNAIAALLPQAIRQPRETQLRARTLEDVDAAFEIVRAAVTANPNISDSAITFPNRGGRDNSLPLHIIRAIRNFDSNQTSTNALRDEIVNARLQQQLLTERRTWLRELLTAEAEDGVFGPHSRATYNQVAAALTRQVYFTLFDLDGRGLAFPPGCPVQPPRSNLSNRAVSDELFRSFIRRIQNGENIPGMNWQLPTLAPNANLSIQHLEQFDHALGWLRRANQAIAPLELESQRQALSQQITALNRPGWARENYPNVEQWHARARTMVALALQMRNCAQLVRTLHGRFDNFPLGDIDSPPPLPDRLDLSPENVTQIQNALAWLQRHQDRLATQLNRLVDAQGGGIFMLGDVDHRPGTMQRGGQTITYNRIVADFEVVEGPNNTLRVTPIVQYHNHDVPMPGYLDRFLNTTGLRSTVVFTERGDTQTVSPDDLIFVARDGRVQLMRAGDLSGWRNWNNARTVAGDGLAAAVDVSMIVSGTIELRAGWIAAANALRTSGWVAAGRALGSALIHGGWNLALGSTAIYDSPYFGNGSLRVPFTDWNLGVTASQVNFARHVAFLFDAGRALYSGRGAGQVRTVPVDDARTFQEVIQATAWMRRTEAVVQWRIPGLGPNDRLRQLPVLNRIPRGWQGDLITPFMLGMLTLDGAERMGMIYQRLHNWWTGQRPPDLDPNHMNLEDISQQLMRMQQSPTFFIAFTDGLLANSGLNATQIATFRGIVADARPDQQQQPPARRLDREQQLIDQFNRPGATERERLVAAGLVLIEGSRSTTDRSVPAHLGNANSGIASQTVKDYLFERFRNSGDPAIRFLAAQMLVSTRNMSPPEFATFCVSLARNNNTPQQVRMQAITVLAGYFHTARAAERVLNSRIASGVNNQLHMDAYLTDNFGVTAADLRACLNSIATDTASSPDIRAFSAASLHAVNRGDSDQAQRQLQSVVDRWNAATNQAPGSFAVATLNSFAQDMALPFNAPPPQDRINLERVFMASSALTLLADPAFNAIWRAQRTAAAGNLVAAFANAPFEPGMLGAAQPPLALRPIPLTPEALNNALLSCVNGANPDVAVQALQLLLPRLNPTEQQRDEGITALSGPQATTLRTRISSLLSRLTFPQGQLTEEQLQHFAAARLQIIRMLPTLFATASDRQRNDLILDLGNYLRPSGGYLKLDRPEIREAAALVIGQLIQSRPAARFFVGDQISTLATDTLSLSLWPNAPLLSGTNQLFVLRDGTATARLEAAVRHDPSPIVRTAALQALLQAAPPILSNRQTLQQFCTELLATERDPSVLALLRTIEFRERAPDHTSADYLDDFQRSRHDLLLSLNCQGDRSLAGMPAFIRQHLSIERRLNGPAPYNQPHYYLNEIALGARVFSQNATEQMNGLKALTYIILANGRPFELSEHQQRAVRVAVRYMEDLCEGLNVNANPERTRHVLWALELGLVLQPNLNRQYRLELLVSYLQLVQRMPADAALRERAGVIISMVLQREFTSFGSDTFLSRLIQDFCIERLAHFPSRASLLVLELIARTGTHPPIRTAAQARLQEFLANPQINTNGVIGGPMRGSVAFDDEYERLQRQLMELNNSMYAPPGRMIGNGPTVEHVTNVPGDTPARRTLIRSFANGDWFTRADILRHAPHVHYILANSYQMPAPLVMREFRPTRPNVLVELYANVRGWGLPQFRPEVRGQRDPEAGFRNLLALAERNGSNAQGNARVEELRAQNEARLALIWIVAVNGEGLVPSLRDRFVRDASACLARISGNRLVDMSQLDSLIESALVGQPLMSQDRWVRDNLITALWNRRASIGGSIANERVALILAGALRSEFQTMPRQGEPGFELSQMIQTRILDLLQQLGHRMCAPVVEAIALHHPIADIRARAQETLLALNDNVFRVWNTVSRAQIDTTTDAATRANALIAAIASNGAPDNVAQAMFQAYLGRPITANDPRYRLFMECLSDSRPHVRLAAALVVLRTANPTTTGVTDTLSSLLQPDALLLSPINQFTENTGFNQKDRKIAMAAIANIALRGVHVGLRDAARRILLEILPNGSYTTSLGSDTSIAIVKNGTDLSVVETRNGRAVTVLLNNGQIRRQGDGLTPPFLQALLQDSVAAQALGLLSRASISTTLSGPLSDSSVIDYDPITDQNDRRRFWLATDVATGQERVAQLYALVDPRSTAVDAQTKALAVSELIQTAINGNANAMHQISWIFRHLDPALAPQAIFRLNQLLRNEVQGITPDQIPTEQQSRNIERYLDLLLAISQNPSLPRSTIAELQAVLTTTWMTAFENRPQIRQITELLANTFRGPIKANDDFRLDWLYSRHTVLQFAAARDCLLSASTAVTSAQRQRAIQIIAGVAVEGNDQTRPQARTILSELRGADLNTALDALASLASAIQQRCPQDHNNILRCWTLSEELCVSAHLDLDPSSERYLRARFERRRAQGLVNPGEIQDFQVQMNDCYWNQSYDLRSPYSPSAMQRYSVMFLAASERYGRDSLEAARVELAVAKAAYYRSVTSPNANVRLEARQTALDSARHAYQVFALRLGPDAPETCDALYRLATTELSMNNRSDAITHLNQALAIYRRNSSAIGTGNGAWIASQLAQAYLSNGDHANANRISSELLGMISKPTPGSNPYDIINAISSFAEAFDRAPNSSNLGTVTPLLRRALEIARARLGNSDPITLDLTLRLANILTDQGQNAEADALTLIHARQTYQNLTQRYLRYAPELFNAVQRLGVSEVRVNNLKDGITHLNEALEIYRRAPARIGLANGATIASQLAQAYLRAGDNLNAQRMSQELLSIASTNLIEPSQQLHVITALTSMADEFLRLPNAPDHKAAERLLRRALELTRVCFGESAVPTLGLMLKLALTAAARGRNVEAASLMDAAMRLCDQQKTMLPAHRAHLYRAYARVLTQLGRRSDADRANQHGDQLEAMALIR